MNEHVDIAIVRSSPIPTDPRVRKIAKSLSNRYNMIALGWNREGLSIATSNRCTFRTVHFNKKAPFAKLSVIMCFPLFWIWVFINLCKYKPKAIHACDLDSILPSLAYTSLFRKRLVFDVFDRYAHSRISTSRKVLFNLINALEEKLAEKSDVLITVTDRALQSFKRKPQNCQIILNSIEDIDIRGIIRTEGLSQKYKLTLCYTGLVVRNRGIERILDAIKEMDDVSLLMSGRIIDKDLLNQAVQLPNVKYNGFYLNPLEALALEADSDVIVAIYNLRIPNFITGSPNKLFEAMMLGKPVITNREPEIVQETRCGISVNYDDLDEIKKAIILLKDNRQIRESIGQNGRRAFLKKYNWNEMEKKLYEIYDSILDR